MASSRDFTANQIRVAKLIMTGTQSGDGGISATNNLSLSVYDESIASDQVGGVSDGNMYASVGTETAIFVSGGISYDSRSSGNTQVLFGGNVGTSGSMHFMNNQQVNATATLAIDFAGLVAHGDTQTQISFLIPTAAGGEHDSNPTEIKIDEGQAGGAHPASTNKIGIGAQGETDAQIAAFFINAVNGVFSTEVVKATAGVGTAGVQGVTATANGSTGVDLKIDQPGQVGNLTNVITLDSGGGPGVVKVRSFSGATTGNSESVYVYADNYKTKNLYLKGALYASGSRDADPYGTISGSIHHTRDGSSYLVAGTNVTITSASNGQVTIASTGGGGGGDASLNYYDEFNGSPTNSPFAAGTHTVVIGDTSLADSNSTQSLVFGTNNTGSAIDLSVIGGGESNTILNLGTTTRHARGIVIAGGQNNIVTGSSAHSVVGGGFNNIITGSTTADNNAGFSTISGGNVNFISGSFNTVGGGGFNKITSEFATIAGGQNNLINKIGDASSGFIGGGKSNTGSSDYSAIGGGESQVIGVHSDFSFIGGGQGNNTSGNSGADNSHYATIPGGSLNKIAAGDGQQAPHSSILGGYANSIIGADKSSIAGGQNNLIQNNHDKSMLVGQHLTSSEANQVVLGYGSAFSGTGYVVASGSYFKSDGLNGGAITGSITRTVTGDSYLVAGTNVTITSASNGQVTIASSGGGGGSSEVKALYSLSGPKIAASDSFIFNSSPAKRCKSDISIFTGKNTSDVWGDQFQFISNIPDGSRGVADGTTAQGMVVRFIVPDGKTATSNVKIKLRYTVGFNGAAGNKIELRVAGRMMKDDVVKTTCRGNGGSTSGAWRDAVSSSGTAAHSPNGWLYFLVNTSDNGLLDVGSKVTQRIYTTTSQTYNLRDLVNQGDSSIGTGEIVDLMLVRNSARSGGGNSPIGDTTGDTFTGDNRDFNVVSLELIIT